MILSILIEETLMNSELYDLYRVFYVDSGGSAATVLRFTSISAPYENIVDTGLGLVSQTGRGEGKIDR